MPFADDVRNYRFPSLDNPVSKTGNILEKHPYIPTDIQMEAMDEFVDAMDLTVGGEDDEDTGQVLHFLLPCLLF